ncbi:hydroxyacylglutathione hydrolase [Azospirillum fermentarium]|uniref:hydroxyacylglutathione hydrolase n=1 Tax=Azospirillum fermentarium TaxID=1233114 RepID=UPI0022263DC9|nr:hydroxyacylglutathione hydrolase [Azospirillum fermentarium]MCW2246781.1 hydroxyacylglutathione hydrolase [Azospirillum fermentarium]
MDIHRIPAFDDNYIYLLHDGETGTTAVVDPGDAAPVQAELDRRGWRLTHILLTHHHNDHIGGVAALKAAHHCTVAGPRADRHRIPDMDALLSDGEVFSVGPQQAQVFFVPGHTSGHIAYYFPGLGALFCGDTLFALGCGRLFEGTAEQMWDSLSRLRALPAGTRVYCAHEYTLSNARFAVTVDPDNAALARRADAIKAARGRGEPTVPFTLEEDRQTNPFLRADDPAVQAAVGMSGAEPAAVFAEIRRRKDVFR